MCEFLGLYPRLGWGRADGPKTKRVVGPPLPQHQRGAQFASIRVHSRFFPSPAPKVRTIPAYGTAIGFGHRHDRRAESPVSCPVFMVNWMNRAFSPQDYHLRTKTSGDAQGWYHAAPLVLGNGAGFWDLCNPFPGKMAHLWSSLRRRF